MVPRDAAVDAGRAGQARRNGYRRSLSGGAWVMMFLVLLLSTFPVARAGRANVLDNFSPPCPTMGEPTTFQRWSDPATWGGGPIPGQGAAAGANVTIACNQAVLLDTSPVSLTLLNIKGFLRVLDSPALPAVRLNAAFIIVQGNFSVGTPQRHFSQRLKIMLTPNPNNRADFLFTENLPAEAAFPRNMGHKAFVVIGGQMDFHGMPGGSSTPAWTKLSATARPNDLAITVDGDASAWPTDGFLVVSSTDYFPEQAEVLGIVDVSPLESGGCRILLESPIRFMHFGDPRGIPDGFGGFIDERAEVALLNRTIAIVGSDDPAPHHLEGGHLIVFMTNTKQVIEGVEFAQMGQQGKLGRYNIHFHICGDQEGHSVVRKNVMHDSKQRCIVVHTTFNLLVEENVAYHTRGHCFMVEEGGETGNTFLRNLGMWTRGVEVRIPLSSDPTQTDETDNSPSTFWITNPNNNLIENVAAGSEDSGFWMELRDRVRGFTLSYPGLNASVPANGPFGIYRDNVAHSNRGPGWRTYPKGVRPRQEWSLDSPKPQWQWQPATGTISGLLLYKQAGDGFFMHNSDGIIITNGTFADNRQGINLAGNAGVQIIGSRFVALTQNLGTPRQCDATPQLCAPVTGCQFPLPPGTPGRSMGWQHWRNPVFGIAIDQPTWGFDFNRAHVMKNCTFHNYDPTCRPAAALNLGINSAPRDTWASSTSVEAFQGTSNTNMMYFAPKNFTFANGDINKGSEASDLYSIFDRDGSVLGPAAGTSSSSSSIGYIVANNSALLPPSKRSPQCTPMPAWNAFACPRSCYRSVYISYLEPGFTLYENSSVPDTRKRGNFSYLSFRRLEDNIPLVVDGNLRASGMPSSPMRHFIVPLLANATYEVQIGLPLNNRAFFPTNVTIQVRDSTACLGHVTLRIGARQSNQWMVPESGAVSWKPCAGTSEVTPVQFSFVCFKFKPTLELSILGNYTRPVTIFASPTPVQGCRLPYRCGIFPSRSLWTFDTSGRALHASVTGGMGFTSPKYNDKDWSRGQGIIGYAGWKWPGIATWTPPSGDALPTFYFRRPFSVSHSACVTGLYMDVILNDGVVLYLNGVELMRSNMPQGAVNVSSRALINLGLWDYTSFFIPLNASSPFSLAEGTNHLAAESHAATWTNENFFDLRLSAQMDNPTCSGVLILQEVCDGLDNNNDGKVDIDPSTNLPLTRLCRNPCGVGVETCVEGAFQNCTAPVHGAESCNGVDDNCDGLVDNSFSQALQQLDCPAASVCFKGACLPVANLSQPVPVFPRGAPNWLYYEKGFLPQTYPGWSTASSIPLRLFKEGSAPFGLNAANTTTNLTVLASGDTAYFFIKNFTLTEAEVNETWSFGLSMRRDDGALVFVNGREMWRTNMPAGDIAAGSFAAGGTWGADKTTYYASPVLRDWAASLKPGLNWIAVQLQQSQWGNNEACLDLEMTRHAMLPCSLLPNQPKQCVRLPPMDTVYLPARSNWTFNDASMPAPAADSWFLPSFDDSQWKQGPSPIGVGVSGMRSPLVLGSAVNSSRAAYYFRRTITVTDATCNVAVTVSINVADGAVLYVNGVEAHRHQMQPAWWGAITSTTTATGGAAWRFVPIVLSGSWLKQGENLIAVGVHQHRITNTYVQLDAQVTAKREATNCTPGPP